jgi:hypothetical protein
MTGAADIFERHPSDPTTKKVNRWPVLPVSKKENAK